MPTYVAPYTIVKSFNPQVAEYCNYPEIVQLVCRSAPYINTYGAIHKFDKLTLISHGYKAAHFHAFPHPLPNTIIQLVQNTRAALPNYNTRLFLTRGDSNRGRNLTNKREIEIYLGQHDFHVFNPECESFSEMVARINHTDILVITWGSTLTNMCFLKPGAKVLILKSASYMHETIELFRKIIQARQIHVSVIEADDNVIDTDRIHKWLNENGLITTDDATNKNLHTEEQENTAEKAGI